MSNLWQHPYVNVFKYFNLGSWKRSSKEGEVASSMDKQLKGTVYKITGSIPAGNFIQLPKTSSQSLGLTGRYFYLLFKPIASKYFVVHIDLVTPDNLVVRLSFSNLFKEFKATSTWLQFPFLCNTDRGCAFGYSTDGNHEKPGPAPISSRWTVLCLDFHYILSMYLNRKFSYMKSMKLCANMLVKNVFTSDSLFEPGLTVEAVKKSGCSPTDVCPMPREMAFPLMKTDNWHDHYDLIRFPSEIKCSDSASTQASSAKELSTDAYPPKHLVPKTVDVSRCVSDRVSMIHSLTSSKKSSRKRISVTKELPSVGVEDISVTQDEQGEVHIFAHPNDQILVHRADKCSGNVKDFPQVRVEKESAKEKQCKTLEPDPILQLKRIVGFGGATYRDCIWSNDGKVVVYPCHAVTVAMKINNGHQRFFIGHTDKVSCLSLTANDTLLATGQTGSLSVVRVWNFRTGDCLGMCKTHVHSLRSVCFSISGNILCGVGKDGQGKNMVVLWNTAKVNKTREITVLAKAHTDMDIQCMKIASFDETRMVSCGRDNIRVWRVKEGSLRSAPVNMSEYHSMEFADVCFEAGYNPNKDPFVYACSRTGHIFEIDLQKLSIHHVRRLLPNAGKSKQEKQNFNSGGGISINTMKINETFCVTGSNDGFLRLWPLDFAHVFLEAEHEGPVTAVDISADGTKVLAGTSTGNVGILDVMNRGYTTIMRSHTDKITSLSVDPYRKQIVTVSKDHTIRVWDTDTLQQLYDFSAPKECPCVVCYHPSQQVFACGFDSGAVRVFNVASTSMLAEHRQHRGKVIGLAFSPNGDHMYSAGSQGSIALYDSSKGSYQLIRLLSNTVARGEKFGPDAVVVSPTGQHVAFIGPSEFTISVVNARSLDEVMRIDITHMHVIDNSRTAIDSALKVYYTPLSVKQLLVTTSSQKLLKFNALTGRLLAEIGQIHRADCTSMNVTEDGRYLATAGDRVVKIWDYNMDLDINFQVFIGHSELISCVQFMPDGQSFISSGEALYLWDFLAEKQPTPYLPEGRDYTEKDWLINRAVQPSESQSSVGNNSVIGLPRHSPPQPTRYDRVVSPDIINDLSSIHKGSDIDELNSDLSEKEEVVVGPELVDEEKQEVVLSKSSSDSSPLAGPFQFRHKSPPVISPHKPADNKSAPNKRTSKPTVQKHFQQREKSHSIAQRRYTAPPNQAGLKLQSVIGYNGNGRSNMVWQPDTGLFIYTSGCVLIVEDLNTSSQKYLQGHVEEISTLALQSDCQVIASASGSYELTTSQICVWDIQSISCKRTLSRHDQEVICLSYSRDDRFLISVGDYRDCSVVVWSTSDYNVLARSTASYPIHDVRWDPFSVNEFTSVGADGSLLFWLLDETAADVTLNVHQADVPKELLYSHTAKSVVVDFTALEYAGDSTLYVSTSNGKVSAWDTRQNSCFLHWEADNSEIGYLVCRHGRLLSGSVGGNLRLWSIESMNEMKVDHNSDPRQAGLMMEDEMTVDGSVSSLAFDDILEMGIVGTTSGTLWYINWSERTSIRLVSGHSMQVNSIGQNVCSPHHFVTCSDDGSLRVWSLKDREQVLQFQVAKQKCTCLAVSPVINSITRHPMSNKAGNERDKMPHVVSGYDDGTVRMFDIDKVEMILKLHPHAVKVTAISFSDKGVMILSGGSDGLIAVSSPTTGLTVRVITDHKGAPITTFDLTPSQDSEVSVTSPHLWLASSADRRVSVWSADWSKDFCELVDWLTFPAPAFAPDGTIIPKDSQDHYSKLPTSMAKFSPDESDMIVYIGYGMQRHVSFYSMAQRKVVRTAALTHWATSLDLCPTGSLIALGSRERLLKLMDYYEGSFQDFVGLNDSVKTVKFTHDGKLLLTAAHSEIFIWEVMV